MKIMKKIIIALIALLLFSPCVFAKTGGPIECVGKGKFALSLDTEYIPEQRMRQDKYYMSQVPSSVEGEWNVAWHNIRMKSDSYSFKFDYGIFDNLDVFVKVGAQRDNLEMEYRRFSGAPEFYSARFIGDYAPCVGGGFKAHLFSLGSICDVGFSTQYLYHKSKLKLFDFEEFMFSGTLRETVADIQTSETDYHSWDATLYFYKQFKYVTPYIGAKYQNSIYEAKVDVSTSIIGVIANIAQSNDPIKFEQDMPWILFGGVDFHINKRLDANIELSTFGSRSVSFGMTWKF